MANVKDAVSLSLGWDVGSFTTKAPDRMFGLAEDVFVNPVKAPAVTLPGSVVSVYLTSLQKRLFDVSIALLLVAILSPLLLLVGMVIATTSRGPIIFRQVRNGINGTPFTIYKFRSMTEAACNATSVEQACRGDSRITSIGRFIRRTSIDELPQLFNVIEGTMSLVGPRPHAISHDAHFGSQISLYSGRFAARPGISGLAQVSGSRGSTPNIWDMERRVELDLRYINGASLLGDICILARTVRETLASTSAY